jgi:signal transduction histidine kinase
MSLGAPRVLVVEDHEPDRELILDVLHEAHTDTCGRLRDALELAQGHDLVVLDLGLPDSQGAITFQTFQAAHPTLPVVVLTGTDDVQLGESLISLGAEDYVPKRELRTRLSTAVLHTLVRRERQRAAEEARAFATSVLAEALTGFALVRLPDELIFSNPAMREVLAVPEGEAIALPEELMAAVQHPGTRRMRVHLQRGTVRWLQVRVSRVDLSGADRLLSVDDITESVEVESQLAHAQRLDAMGRIAGGVAHDLNNCLTAIRAFTEFGRQGSSSTEVRADLDEALLATARAESLTTQLLAFSRRKRVAPTVVNPAVLVYDLTRMLSRVLGDGVVAEATCQRDTPRVWADKTALEQVLVNLAVNARDALGGPGRVRLLTDSVEVDAAECARRGLGRPGTYARVRVIDEGCGMSPEVLGRAFEPFFTTKPQDRGTGLGLATSYGLIVQAGGQLSAESAEGQGTTMTVYLPAHEAEYESVPDSPSVQGSPFRRGLRVLLAEDDVPVRRALQRALLDEGYEVFAVPDGRAALDLTARVRDTFDLLVTDLQMPRLGGRELVTELVQRFPDTLVLTMSGHATDYLPDFPFLEKPFPPAKFLSTLASLISSTPTKEHPAVDPLEGRAQVADGFEQLLASVPAVHRDAPALGVWADRRIAYLNDAYVRHAAERGGNDLLTRFPLGSSLDRAIPEVLKRLYNRGWSRLRDGEGWQMLIECNDTTTYRAIRMSAIPLWMQNQVVGALFRYRTRTESPMHRKDHSSQAARLTHAGSTMCVNCVRTLDAAASPPVWLWVAANLSAPPVDRQWALCDRCEQALVIEPLDTKLV